ncbi:UDP-glycosyltransferase 86A1 [Abeliophyllum distichum]|uniref:Glycosyltransferase n=1 Tax=Abeliophyllum distichum TaxID=126358 RepID=A0ABD1RG16_9LAMI
MADTKQKPHALLFPYPLQGHVIPFVHLATKLALNGFTITFVNTESIHQQISKAAGLDLGATGDGDADIFSEARKSGLDIRYATITDGFPLGFDRSLHHDQFFEGILHVFPAYVDDFVGNLVRSDPTINCFIADTFFVWTSMIANKYNLVNISFFTEPALVLTLYYHIDLLRQNGHFATADNRRDAIDYIPGVKSIMPSDLMSYLHATDNISTPIHRIIYKSFDDVKKGDFIIINTVQELEEDTISGIQQQQPIYAIGPIFPPGFTKSNISTSLWAESDCTQWLDTKPHGSVLYVSFGSYAHTSKHEISEIANGLLLSGVNFIWVLRPDIVSSDESDFLPVGFEESVKGRGRIVSWCCQIAVISHPAIGGFLTHCGWNSILESIWCSVPLLCYPLLTDQFTNRKLIVDDLRVGINLCDDKKSVNKKEVSENINRLMKAKASSEIREQVKKVKKVLEDGMGKNGSSARNFMQLIEDLKAKIAEKKGFGIRENGEIKENGVPAKNHI